MIFKYYALADAAQNKTTERLEEATGLQTNGHRLTEWQLFRSFRKFFRLLTILTFINLFVTECNTRIAQCPVSQVPNLE